MKDKIIEILDTAYGWVFCNLFNQLIAQKIEDAIDEKQITKRMIEGWVNRHPTEISVREEECARSFFSWLEGRE